MDFGPVFSLPVLSRYNVDGTHYTLGMQVTAHNVSEEGDIAAISDLEKRGLCMTFLSNEVGCLSAERILRNV